MIGEQRVIAGQGNQTLRFIPVNTRGVPSRVTSATYVIVDIDETEDSADREIATGSATLDAVNTTISAAAGQGQSNALTATLTSTTNVEVGRTYLLSSAARRSLVTVVSLTGSVVTAAHTISGSYANGDAFQAIELEATFPSAEANDADALDEQRRYQIVWTYTIEGKAFVTPQLVTLVRYTGEAWLTEADLVRAYPAVADRIRGRISLADAITVATDDVTAELESSGEIAENYRLGRMGLTLVRFKAIEYALRWISRDAQDVDASMADKFEQRFDRLMRSIVDGAPGRAAKLSQTTDEAVSATIQGLFVKP